MRVILGQLYLLLQHEALSPQVPLKGAPLLHLWAGLLVHQDVVDAFLPVPEEQAVGAVRLLCLQPPLDCQ